MWEALAAIAAFLREALGLTKKADVDKPPDLSTLKPPPPAPGAGAGGKLNG